MIRWWQQPGCNRVTDHLHSGSIQKGPAEDLGKDRELPDFSEADPRYR